MRRVESLLSHLTVLAAQGKIAGEAESTPLENRLDDDSTVAEVRQLSRRTEHRSFSWRISDLQWLVEAQSSQHAEEYRLPEAPGGVVLQPATLPEFDESFSEADRQALLRRAHAATLAQLPPADILATYSSPTVAIISNVKPALATLNDAEWGITLHTAGIEMLADHVFEPARLERNDSLRAAITALLAHEYQHFQIDTAVMSEDVRLGWAADRPHQVAREAHRALHATCGLEEAIAEAAAVRALRAAERHDALPSGVAEAYLDRVTTGPPGYNEGGSYVGDQAFRDGVRQILDHSGVDVATGGLLLADLGELETCLDDVPVHLAISAGSGYQAGFWSWHEVDG